MINFNNYTTHQVNYALKDIQATLKIWRDDKKLNDPYIIKLYKEFDSLITLKQKRGK
tara:strand:- start:156 stop:326 length:171 start_codon:yes stop_codon:yes gene_type:complete